MQLISTRTKECCYADAAIRGSLVYKKKHSTDPILPDDGARTDPKLISPEPSIFAIAALHWILGILEFHLQLYK